MPYVHGHTVRAIALNVRKFIRDGYGKDKAVAVALNIARRVWRQKFPGQHFPEHLENRGSEKMKRTSLKKKTSSKKISTRLKKRRAKNTVAGYYPNPIKKYDVEVLPSVTGKMWFVVSRGVVLKAYTTHNEAENYKKEVMTYYPGKGVKL
jgi:hypothetical protein